MTRPLNTNPADRVHEKRSFLRLSPSAIPSLKSIRLVASPEVTLLNISCGGALVESDAPLMPGSAVSIRLIIGDEISQFRGRILRSLVSAFRGPVLIYQSAIEFEEELQLAALKTVEKSESPEPACAEETGATGIDNAAAGDEGLITLDIPISQERLKQIRPHAW